MSLGLRDIIESALLMGEVWAHILPVLLAVTNITNYSERLITIWIELAFTTPMESKFKKQQH